MECQICIEKINKRNKEITCLHCNHKACTKCCKRFILDTLNDAKCMNCGKNWNREYLVNNFTSKFVNDDYKKHRENIIFDRQLSMMENTQKIIEKRKMVLGINKKIDELREKQSQIQNHIYNLEREKHHLQYGTTKEEKEYVVKFYGHCPTNNCRGFINNTWKCGICDQKVCRQCKEPLELLDDGTVKPHMCNQATLDSLAQIRKDSKPCPKCKTMIHRIEGCHQMFCTQCNCCYGWKTGEIITRGSFHNPHYVEWQRRTGGNITDTANNVNVCGNNEFPYISHYDLQNRIRPYNSKIPYISYKFSNFLRYVNHVNGIDLYHMRNNNNNNENTNEYNSREFIELRVQYLENNITESNFKRKLQWNEKRIQKRQDIYLILDMFVNTGKHIITEFAFDRNQRRNKRLITLEDVVNTNKQINELIVYTNNCMNKISLQYKNKTPIIRQFVNNFKVDFETVQRMGKK
jgi:hypothetical protein